MTLEEQILAHEGLRLQVYDDATGQPIKAGSKVIGHPTIGIGRNLAVGITHDEALILLKNDLDKVRKGLETLPYFTRLSEIRQRVLMDMAFNLGLRGLFGFRTTLLKIEQGKYSEAADYMLQSKWAGQVGQRARRLAYMMRHNKEP
jgi:lysozyme